MSDVLIKETRDVELRLIDADDSKNPRQGRGLDQDGLEEFAARLQVEGQLTPIHVREAPGGRYELVAGYRRYKAATIIGWKKLRAEVFHTHVTDEQARVLSHLENLDRVALSDYDAAKAAFDLSNTQKISIVEYCDRVGADVNVMKKRVAWIRTLPTCILEGWRTGDSRATIGQLTKLADMFPADAEARWHELAGQPFVPPTPSATPSRGFKSKHKRPNLVRLMKLMEHLEASTLPEEVKKVAFEVLEYAQGARTRPPQYPVERAEKKTPTKKDKKK